MRLTIYTFAFSIFMILLLVSCESVKQPKPKAQLFLQYPQPKYKSAPNIFPFDFEYNDWAQLKRTTNTAPDLYYPKMKATLYLSYVGVENNIDSLLNDAYQLPGKHMIKAEEIPERVFMAHEKRVYGTLLLWWEMQPHSCSFFLQTLRITFWWDHSIFTHDPIMIL